MTVRILHGSKAGQVVRMTRARANNSVANGYAERVGDTAPPKTGAGGVLENKPPLASEPKPAEKPKRVKRQRGKGKPAGA